MKFYLQTNCDSEYDCLVVGLFATHKLSPSLKKLDQLTHGYFSQLFQKQNIEGKLGQNLFLYEVPHIRAKCVLIIGCGSDPLSPQQFRQIIKNSMGILKPAKIKNIFISLTELTVKDCNLSWKIKQTVEMIYEANYGFEIFKTNKTLKTVLQTIHLYLPEKNNIMHQNALKQGLAVAQGIEYTKNLANLPSNICTPSYLVSEAKQLKKKYPFIKINILSEKEMKQMGMNAFLAVSQGSVEEAKLICLEYQGTVKKQAPIVLVGKGITFDTGGISLKKSEMMLGMKYDMCGAATVLGVLKTVAELKLPLNVVGILAAAENMPSGSAVKPEDIVTTLSGQTVEIINTDAEGRLVLCDALTYAERYHPDIVIDIATLTGAIVIALGNHATGIMTNDQSLADDLLKAGIRSHDRAWQLPLWEDYQEQIKSPFADLSNKGTGGAGAITAGCFLSHFTKKFRWAHLDVAGTAAIGLAGIGGGRAATGRPLPLLIQFLIDRCHA